MKRPVTKLCHKLGWVFPILFLLAANSGHHLAQAKIVTVSDALGRKVTVNVPIKRAVFLIGYELIPYLDLWNQTVGTSTWAKKDSQFLMQIRPDWLEKIPSVGTASQVNLEALLCLHPDLVITWSYRPRIVEAISRLEGGRIKVLALSPDGLTQLREAMGIVAKLFGKEKRFNRLDNAMDQVFTLVRNRISKPPGVKRPRVVWLWSDVTKVCGGKGVVADLLRTCGVDNPADNILHPYPRISIERLVLWNPEVIIIWGNARFGTKDLLEDPRLSRISAIRNKRVFKAPNWSTWSPRAANLCLWMAKRIYPDRFKESLEELLSHAKDGLISH